MTYTSRSEQDTKALAARLLPLFHKGAVICLDGQMGAGKTAFVKGALEAMGYTGEVSSPTFALCHRYPAAIPVLHYDLYRLRDEDDLYSIGFFDDVESGACVFIEWSGLAREWLPENTVFLSFSYGAQPQERIITVEGGGEA